MKNLDTGKTILVYRGGPDVLTGVPVTRMHKLESDRTRCDAANKRSDARKGS